MTERYIPISAPSVGEEEWLAVADPIRSGWLTQGPTVQAFEQEFARRHGVPYALATTSCTTALHLALVALGVGTGDEVIVPAFTWVATGNVVTYCGAIPVLVDVDPCTYNIDPSRVAEACTPSTRAAIPVHLFGLCADVAAIHEALVGASVAIVEDAACAVGASYYGRPAGSLGHVGCFSFHPRKVITTGEGGMLTTSDPGIAASVTRLRNHGASVPEETRHGSATPFLLPEFADLGFNYRMTDLQAAVGRVQLRKLDALIAQRRRIAARYTEGLRAIGWLTPQATPGGHDHSWQSFTTTLTDDAPTSRDDVLKRLHERGVGARPGTHALSHLRVYRERFGYAPGDFPVADRLHNQSLSLPLHNTMSDNDVEFVLDALETL